MTHLLRGGGRSRVGRPDGATLIEVLVSLAIGVFMLVIVWKVFVAGARQGADVGEEHKLMVDTRALMENLQRDVAATHVFLPPPSGGSDAFKTTVCLARYVTEDAAKRLDDNTYAGFPFFNDGAPTRVKYDLSRVIYRFDAGQITRIEEKGKLDAQPGATDVTRLVRFDFQQVGDRSERVIASNIKKFDLFYGIHDAKGQLKLAANVNQITDASCVGVDYLARQDFGGTRLPGQAGTRRPPEVVIVTKFFTARRLSEIKYKEYTSSADDDLRN